MSYHETEEGKKEGKGREGGKKEGRKEGREVGSLREVMLDKFLSQIKRSIFLRKYFCQEVISPLSKADILIFCSF